MLGFSLEAEKRTGLLLILCASWMSTLRSPNDVLLTDDVSALNLELGWSNNFILDWLTPLILIKEELDCSESLMCLEVSARPFVSHSPQTVLNPLATRLSGIAFIAS